MAAEQFKCPNCGGAVVFDPATQKIVCPFCSSSFEINAFKLNAGAGASYSGYKCTTCGADIITSSTTAATTCYYCHSPIVLTDRLAGDERPDAVIPFKITREQAMKQFEQLFKKKKFLPKVFRDQASLEKLAGVYFPYWFADTTMDTRLRAIGRRSRVWREGNYEVTETSVYNVERAADFDMQAFCEPAIRDSEQKDLTFVNPFDVSDMRSFADSYLAGLYAENKEIEKQAVEPEILKDMRIEAQARLSSTVTGYGDVQTLEFSANPAAIRWHYALLPVWMLTYSYEDQRCVFAINGQTGKIYGELPTDMKKLRLANAAITAAATIIGAIAGGALLCM